MTSISDLKKTFVPVGSQDTPVPAFDDRCFTSAYELLVWEESVLAAEQRRPVDSDATRRMPAIVLRRQIASCKPSTFYGLLEGGYQVNYPGEPPVHRDEAPTLLTPIMRSSQPRSLSVAAVATLALLVAFCAGLLLSPRVVATAKLCPGSCPAPSTCNSNTGRCEANTVNVADTADMNELRKGRP